MDLTGFKTCQVYNWLILSSDGSIGPNEFLVDPLAGELSRRGVQRFFKAEGFPKPVRSQK